MNSTTGKIDWSEKEALTKEEALACLEFANNQILANLPEFTDHFQKAYSENGFYQPVENDDWTNGFWTGEIWLAYEYSGDRRLKEAAEVQVESFYRRIREKAAVDHHDMGFLYSPSCVAAYQLTGNETGKKAALLAADQLMSRFQPKGGFFQAWGPMGAPENYRLIIDCLLNVPLLYWASQVTGDPQYEKAAKIHTHTAMRNVIRKDASTWHTYYFNPETGAPDHGATCQGYRDGSAWARGQAWGIYGSALAYEKDGKNTKGTDLDYLDSFRRVTEYFLTHLPLDLIPYWDLEFSDGSGEPRDSSSASIAACGMLEMAKHLEREEGDYYKEIACKIMKSVADHYRVRDRKESNGLVLHSTYSKKSPYNTCTPCGVDECNSWGDYFYMEALTRIVKDWKPYW